MPGLLNQIEGQVASLMADGAIITYRLGPGSGEAHLSIARSNGEVVREYRVPIGKGVHKVDWDLRHPAQGV